MDNISKVEPADSDFKITPKDVYKEVWECRNFEITNLWQRSVFLAAFMLAIAAGYGTLVHGILFPSSDKIIVRDRGQVEEYTVELNAPDDAARSASYQHLAAVALCYLGEVFSMLWVMMAKGSKLWYERYEGGITFFTDGDYGAGLRREDAEIPYYGNLPELPKAKISESPFSPLAGHYSVSRVNCAIGIVGIYAWGFLSMVHCVMCLKHVGFGGNAATRGLLSVALCLFASALAYGVLYVLCKSGEKN